jgi:hypothetical protein
MVTSIDMYDVVTKQKNQWSSWESPKHGNNITDHIGPTYMCSSLSFESQLTTPRRIVSSILSRVVHKYSTRNRGLISYCPNNIPREMSRNPKYNVNVTHERELLFTRIFLVNQNYLGSTTRCSVKCALHVEQSLRISIDLENRSTTEI